MSLRLEPYTKEPKRSEYSVDLRPLRPDRLSNYQPPPAAGSAFFSGAFSGALSPFFAGFLAGFSAAGFSASPAKASCGEAMASKVAATANVIFIGSSFVSPRQRGAPRFLATTIAAAQPVRDGRTVPDSSGLLKQFHGALRADDKTCAMLCAAPDSRCRFERRAAQYTAHPHGA